MTTAAHDDRLVRRIDAMLWVAVLAGPAAWLVDLQASYVLVPAACRHSVEWPLHLVTLLTVAPPAVGAWLAARARRLALDSGALPATLVDRVRFMATIALALCALFGLLLLATAVAKVVHSPCDGF